MAKEVDAVKEGNINSKQSTSIARSKEGKITSQIVQFQEGDHYVVKLLKIEPFTSGSLDAECMRYVGMTADSHVISFILGGATDKQMMEAGVEVGDIIAIEYLGKREISGGRKVNLFDIEFSVFPA